MSKRLSKIIFGRPIKILLSVSFGFILMASTTEAFSQTSIITKVPINTRSNGTANNPAGYVEYLPTNYDSRNDWPVLIWFHGLGEDGDGSAADLDKIANRQIMNWLKNNDVPFIVLAPQDIAGQFYGGLMQEIYQWSRSEYGSKSDEAQWHIQVLSASGGGMKNWLQAATADLSTVNSITLSASILNTSGFTTTKYNNIINSGVRLWFHHGVNDNTVQIGGQRGFYKNIVQTLGGYDFDRYRFTAYTGLGHSAWNKVFNNSGRTSAQSTGIIYGGNTVVGDYYHWTTESWYDWMTGSTNESQPIPTVNAGTDKILNLPTNSINLTGSASSNGGTISSYQWSKINGPATVTVNNATSTTVSLSGLVAGIYTFRLTATDDLGQKGSDDVKVTVNSANQNPVVSAGSDKTITLPTNSVTLNGSSSDADGTISTKTWTQRNGPTTATLTGVNSNTLNVSSLVEGTYRFRLTATDDDGATSFDQADVVVNPEATNSAPAADAGPDKTVNLPTNSATLNGSGSDDDGSIVSYLWEKVTGPSGITIGNASNNILELSDLVEGTYQFRLTVTDNEGATDDDLVNLEVIAANINPNVNAGSDIEIVLPTNSASIIGSASDSDGSISSYLWEQVSGPNTATVTNATTSNLTASNLIEGEYVFSFSATDNDGAEASDEMILTVSSAPANKPPTLNAGVDQAITLPLNSVTLTGSASDTDGIIASYSWTKISGPNSFAIASPSNKQTQITGLVAGTYIFKLTATDNDGASASDNVTVNVAPETVNQSPTANAGPNKSITLPENSLTLNGSASDPDGTIESYQWTQDSGPNIATIESPNASSTIISILVEGTYFFSLQVTDNEGAINTDQVRIRVTAANVAPEVSAGVDLFINLPQDSVKVIGSASDTDGTITSSSWTQIGGALPTIIISGDTLFLSDLLEGTYSFQFTATDDDGASSSSQFTLTVSSSTNILPSVNAGNDATINLPTSSINLTANATDSDGSIDSYFWEQKSGPSATLSNPDNKTVSVSDLTAGNFMFKVTATDNEGGFASDEVAVLVLEGDVNQSPLADAGESVIIALPITSTTLSGLGFDNDGSITAYLWTKKSGPTATLKNETTGTLTLSSLVVGTYSFEFRVTDNDGATGSDLVQLIVNPAEINQNPIANAGNNTSIVLPINSTNLPGSASDPDGEVVSYQWVQTDGPANATLVNATLANVNVSELVEGSYTFKLTVTDNADAIDEDEVNVTVLPESTNIPPVANAGKDINLFLPTNSVNIIGSGSDDDGTVNNYKWTKVSGPSAVVLTNAQAATLNVSSLVTGIYEFKITVTDNDGSKTSDIMRLRVFPATTNQSPSVNAGSDLSLSVAVDSIKINAEASDPDGNILSFLWSKTSGIDISLKDITSSQITINDLVEGIFNLRINVTDNDGAVSFDEIKVTILSADANSLPSANAGNDITIKLPKNSTSIPGSGFDADGTITSFIWEQKSGPPATLQNETTPTLGVSDIIEGTYSFTLEVADEDGATDEDEMTLFVLSESINLSPTVNAGPDQFVEVGSGPVIFIAEATDEDGTVDSYNWEQTSGGNISLSGETTNQLKLSDYISGQYEFRVEVSDNNGFVDSDFITLSVLEENISNPPMVSAGADTVLIFPVDTLILSGIVESENLISRYEWKQLLGPPIGVFPVDTNNVLLTNIRRGDYLFELTVSDVDSLSSKDEVNITVRDENDNNDFPIIFTPNNDGVNDFWVIENSQQIEGCNLVIYDINGRKVFSSNSYRNDWDGTSNGSPLPSGAYYYIFKCNGNSKISGGIRIIR